uniref:Uncharacterized protein n=1 Tax=Neobodo designis TaxID=312471 RepID=A0A6U4PCQ7_NEODS
MSAKNVPVLKTAMSERMPLAERARQAAEDRAAALAAAPTAGQEAARSYFLPKRHTGYTTYGEASRAYIRNAADVPARATERGVKAQEASLNVVTPKFEGTTTNKSSTAGYAEEDDATFYSRIRVRERCDDDARHSLEDPKTRSGAAKNLRCSAIQTKRETDPEFAPKPMMFKPVPRVRPNNTVTAHGSSSQPARSHSAAPALGGTGSTQSGNSTITKFDASARSTASVSATDVARATFVEKSTTQKLDFPDPRTAAQVASATLGAKKGRTLLAPDRALVEGATSRDLFAGTAKAFEDVASGYMGHVPANPANVARVRGAGDQLRAHMKTVDTVTAPTHNSTTSLLRAKLQAAQAAAEQEIGRPLTPKTTSAFYVTQAASAADEKRINRVECGRRNAVRGFFTRGVGEQDDLVADQFCLRYRPLEGAMRHGPPHEQSWINDSELRRNPRL